jgi:glycosyltransferase involved in cell wall biosynthesis
MKVLMQGRYELLDKGGGDKIQIENTAAELRDLGVEVDIKVGFDTDLSPYDVIHVFQLDWTPETYFYAKNAKKAGKPLVLSPIHHNINEVKKFDDEYVFDLRRISKVLFKDQHNRDTFKNVYRSVFNLKKAGPTVYSVFYGLKRMHRKTLSLSDIVLVQTEAEARDLEETYKVSFDWRKVPNGVGRPFLNNDAYENKLDMVNYIICVGRIEPRKNQLSVIEAVKNFRENHDLDVNLVLIGTKAGRQHFEYSKKFDEALKKYPWIRHIEKVPYEEMPSYYHFAKVGVSASWFETTGLTSLEAVYSGTNAVAAGERAEEYLGNLASYCRPDDIGSIEKAIEKEYFSDPKIIPAELYNEYTWENAARKTLEAYKVAAVR